MLARGTKALTVRKLPRSPARGRDRIKLGREEVGSGLWLTIGYGCTVVVEG